MQQRKRWIFNAREGYMQHYTPTHSPTHGYVASQMMEKLALGGAEQGACRPDGPDAFDGMQQLQ